MKHTNTRTSPFTTTHHIPINFTNAPPKLSPIQHLTHFLQMLQLHLHLQQTHLQVNPLHPNYIPISTHLLSYRFNILRPNSPRFHHVSTQHNHRLHHTAIATIQRRHLRLLRFSKMFNYFRTSQRFKKSYMWQYKSTECIS